MCGGNPPAAVELEVRLSETRCTCCHALVAAACEVHCPLSHLLRQSRLKRDAPEHAHMPAYVLEMHASDQAQEASPLKALPAWLPCWPSAAPALLSQWMPH